MQLWDQGLVSRLLANGSLSVRTTGLLALIETPEAMEAYLLRAQGQDDAKRRAHRCITAVQEGLLLIDGSGCSNDPGSPPVSSCMDQPWATAWGFLRPKS